MTNIKCLIGLILLCYNQANANCRLHICFTWKISIKKLTLVCKIEHIDHIVSVLNNKHEEIAGCHPTGISRFSCSPHVANVSVSITENIVTVLFTGSIDERVNGIWTCKHGSSLTDASVEVTVLYEKEQKSNVVLSSTIVPENRIEEERPLSWLTVLSSSIGFVLGVVFTIFLTTEYVKDKISTCQSNYLHYREDASGKTCCLTQAPILRRRVTITKVIVTIVLMLIIIMFPLYGPKILKIISLLVIFFGLFGLVLGVVCILFWKKDKGTNPEPNNDPGEGIGLQP